MNPKLTLRRLGAVAILATLGAGLLAGSNASSPEQRRDAALDKAITAGMQRASIPGAIVGIWQDGREPYVRAFGVRDTATREPMATDLYMRIGSVTKTFTVTSILMLADQGKLGLDDPVDRYVKGVPGGNQPRGDAQRPVRLQRGGHTGIGTESRAPMDAARTPGDQLQSSAGVPAGEQVRVQQTPTRSYSAL
jgi:CubicO group peptidase (beta-lactamase class C family)